MRNNYEFAPEKHPALKGNCPKCAKTKCFRYFENLPREFGICDHINKCNYKNIPTYQKLKSMGLNTDTINLSTEQIKTIVVPGRNELKVLNNINSVFHVFCKKLGINDEHLKKWNIGADNYGNTAFVLQTLSGKQINIKMFKYVLSNDGKDCKRDKNNYPRYLKAKENEQYQRCLFGEHLLTDKIICLVESEKTAVIASFFYNQFDWLATGGANGVKIEYLQILKEREVYYLPDNDKAGKENSTIKYLKLSGIKFQQVKFETAKDGEDIADLIIRGDRPEIVPSSEKIANTTIPQTETKNKEVSKNLSEYERVENFISERYEIRNNIVSNKIEFRVKNIEETKFIELNENNVFRELQKNHISFSLNKLKSLLASDFPTPYNPFQYYFDSLPEWNLDSDPDYIVNLAEYLPIRDKARFQTQFKKWLVRSVSCSLGYTVNKQAFILVHDKQNSGKTTFLRWLCPDFLNAYIAENTTTDKDSLIAMCTNFLINQDELSTLNKSEINALKAVMSKDIFKGRLPYGAREVSLRRRANIVGSTNATEFLSDETGSVRWLCFELLDRINFDYKKDIDINNIWAQAYSLFKAGFKGEMTPEDISENERANESFRIRTPEIELIQEFLKPSSKETTGALFCTSTQIHAILNDKAPTIKINSNSIGKGLKVLGFNKTQKQGENGYWIKGYYIEIIK